MKKPLALFQIMVLLLPAFGPWMPHSALQSLHIQQELHHGISTEHDHHSHSHDLRNDDSHSVNFDIVTYFSDYLHVDLRNGDQVALSVPLQSKQSPHYVLTTEVIRPVLAPSSANQSRGPPDYDWRISDASTPIYLATQRLRI